MRGGQLISEVDYGITVEIRGAVENGFCAEIVLAPRENEIAELGAVAGEGSRGVFDIGFGIVALAEEK